MCIRDSFDSDADIVDHQVAIIEYENKAVLSFHTNMKVPDEYRRFAVIGSSGMIEGDFVRGYVKAHDENNKFKIGDFVQIRECAPKSKTKTFEVVNSD